MLRGDHPERGRYEFWLSDAEPAVVLKIRVTKNAGQIRSHGCQDPQRRSFMDKKSRKRIISPATTLETYPILYHERRNIRQVSSLTDHLFINLDDPNASNKVAFHWAVDEVKRFKVGDSSRAHFSEISVPEGTPVQVHGQLGVKYEFRNGRMERVIDTAGIEEMEGVRFRKPPERRSWTLPMSLALLVVIAVWIVARKRRAEK